MRGANHWPGIGEIVDTRRCREGESLFRREPIGNGVERRACRAGEPAGRKSARSVAASGPLRRSCTSGCPASPRRRSSTSSTACGARTAVLGARPPIRGSHRRTLSENGNSNPRVFQRPQVAPVANPVQRTRDVAAPAQSEPIGGGPTGVAGVAKRRSVGRSHTVARSARRMARPRVARQGGVSLGRDVSGRSRATGAALAGRGPRDWPGETFLVATTHYRSTASVQVEQDPPRRPQEHAGRHRAPVPGVTSGRA